MKCQYCGGDVSLDDRFCPYCGRRVDQAERHQKEMEAYEGRFEETREEALKKADNAGGGLATAVGIRLVILAVLIVAMIVIGTRYDSYEVNQRRQEKEITTNEQQYKALIEQLLEDRDYAQLAALERRRNITDSDLYSDYKYIIYASDYYNRAYRGLLGIAYYRPGSEMPYYTEQLSKSIASFYDQISPDYYERYAANPDKTKEVFGQMEQQMQILLRRYLGLSEEEAASFKDLSKSRRTVIIESAVDEVVSGTPDAGTEAPEETSDAGTEAPVGIPDEIGPTEE